jgi:LysR family glycine cleavage system transcriptional activator
VTFFVYVQRMLRRSPPLVAIEIFVAAAHARSFRAAARSTALSPSAVSRRISSLETFLGIILFDRSGPVPTLTAAGAHYLALIEPAMEAIRRATTMASENSLSKLKIATSHSLATNWLMPRLKDLRRAEGIEVDILPTRHFDALRSGEAHLGIWGGLAVPDDMVSETIAHVEVIPVAAPTLLKAATLDGFGRDIASHTLLSVSSPASLWERWFAGSGTPSNALDIREFATLQLTYEAAASGLGIALAIPMVAEPYLRSGRLVPCQAKARDLGECYRLYRPRRRASSTGTEDRFAAWLRRAASASLEQFRTFTMAGEPAAGLKSGDERPG